MKVLGISASPKGKESQTLRLVVGVLDGAEVEGAETELIDVCDYDLEFCTACGTCYAKGECIHTDDYGEIFGKILDADGIVLGSPNYIDSVTAQLKVLQEIITLIVFSGFSVLYLKDEFRWNYAVGFALIVAAVFFIFKKW